ncbi:MAG TPA: hypothetical protein VFN67_20490 [Polyangiales bacterium]|jgi:hypothetical protein|nr:hypothetical protein [Polyangiales bacterium]
MSGVRICLVVFLGISIGACKATPSERPAELEEAEPDHNELPPPAAAKAPEPEAPPPAAKGSTPPAADGSETPSAAQLPVAEDFQLEMTAAIVRSNYRHELDNLESELRADGE